MLLGDGKKTELDVQIMLDIVDDKSKTFRQVVHFRFTKLSLNSDCSEILASNYREQLL